MRYLSGKHWFSHQLLGMIVIGADVFIFQEREQFIFMALQPLDELPAIFKVVIGLLWPPGLQGRGANSGRIL